MSHQINYESIDGTIAINEHYSSGQTYGTITLRDNKGNWLKYINFDSSDDKNFVHYAKEIDRIGVARP